MPRSGPFPLTPVTVALMACSTGARADTAAGGAVR